MRKSTLFISAALTTFMLAVMFGVASAYQKIVQAGVPTEAAQQQVQPTNVVVAETATTVSNTVTAEQAAALASNVMGRTDLFSAENSQLNGVNAYLVTFSSGDLVYVSMDGKILSISKLPVTYIVNQTTTSSHGSGNNHSNSNNSGNSSANVTSPATSAPSTGGGEHQDGGGNGGGGQSGGGDD